MNEKRVSAISQRTSKVLCVHSVNSVRAQNQSRGMQLYQQDIKPQALFYHQQVRLCCLFQGTFLNNQRTLYKGHNQWKCDNTRLSDQFVKSPRH